jgi:membrane associated rhomboid family serine protease
MSWMYGLLIILELVLPIPLKDDRGKNRGFPVATATLVAINVLVQIILMWALARDGADAEQLFKTYGIVPQDVLARHGLGALSLVTAGFIHAGWLHLIGNMFILWFFGRKVEDLIGPVSFFLFFLLCLFGAGIASTLGRHALSEIEAGVPSIGASGAVSGVMAAYLFLYTGEHITTLIIPIPWLFRLPAWVYISYNFVHDLLLGLLTEEVVRENGFSPFGTDVFAHVGGLIVGLIFIYLYLPAEALLDYRQNRR